MSAFRLLALSEILPSDLEPVPAIDVSPAEALGAISAEDVALPEGWPRATFAREPGYAVSARSLIGATAYEPALLPASTPLLAAGDLVPEGADAILPLQLVAASPAGLEVFSTLRPGEGIRRAQQEWPAGRMLLQAGTQLGPVEQALLLEMGVENIRVRRAAISLDPALPPPVLRLFAAWAGPLGLAIVEPRHAHLRLEAGAFTEPHLALRPGRFGDLQREGRAFALNLPDLAEAVGLWHAIALPLLASLIGARLQAMEGRLAGKIVSGIGFSELAFLRRSGEGWLPLETGDCTLTTLAQTEAVALIPAGSEGHPAGADIAFMPLGGAFATMRDRSSAP